MQVNALFWIGDELLLALADKLITLSVPPAPQLISLDAVKALGESVTSTTEGAGLSSSGIACGPHGLVSFNSTDGTVCLSGMEGEKLQEIVSPVGKVTAVATDGDMLAVGHLDGTLSLYVVRLGFIRV